MPLSITVTRSWAFPAGRPVTLAALRLGALPGGPTSLPPGGGVGPVDVVTPPDANEPILKRLGDGSRMM